MPAITSLGSISFLGTCACASPSPSASLATASSCAAGSSFSALVYAFLLEQIVLLLLLSILRLMSAGHGTPTVIKNWITEKSLYLAAYWMRF